MFAQLLVYPKGFINPKLSHHILVGMLMIGIISTSMFPGWLFNSHRMQSTSSSFSLNSADWASIENSILDAEYHLTWHAPDQKYDNPYFSAPNLEHEWIVTFSPHGIAVSPLNNDNWEWGISLIAYGYAGSMHAVTSPKLFSSDETLSYTWDRNISEWWNNSPSGLEQGFTILSKPNLIQESGSSPLMLEMGLKGNLFPIPFSGGIQFLTQDDDTILTYDRLSVTDALGNVIPGMLKLDDEIPGLIRLEIDDSSATYPLTVDPWVQSAKLTASDGATFDFFGSSVAISGDTIVVGAPFDNGAAGSAYVFTRSAGGWQNMTQTAKLTASDAYPSDNFGYSVAISGDTIVVGAPYDDDGGSSAGSAYIYIRPITGWSTSTETAKLTASDGGANDNLGISVAASGDTIVAGAYRDVSSGSAYVFTRPPTGWTTRTEIAKLTPSDGASNDYFGWSVAVDRDTVIVGAYLDDDNGPSSGSAYVFVRPPGGWSSGNQTAKLTASDGASSDNFGRSVSVSGDIAVAGANLDDNPPRSDSGSAYLFVRPSGGWADMTQTAKLTTSDRADNDQFGFSVAASGDTVVIGTPYDDDNGSDSGSAYVFVQPSTGWTDMTETAKQTASDGAANDNYGNSVAISGDSVVVGASSDDDQGSESGSAYVFQNSFCSKQSGNWGDTTTWVGGVVPSLTNDACISAGHSVALTANAAANRLLVNPNATLDINTNTLTVEDTVTNHGALEQTRTVDGSTSVSFLEIQNNALDSTKYRGVLIDPTGNNQNLGSTSISLRETLDWFNWHDSAGINTTLYCTETGDGSPNYAQRCYTITPTSDPSLSVRVRLWGLTNELNGINESDLSVYRNSVGSTWVELTTNRGVGNDGGSYSYAEGDTADFSGFLLGETGGGNSPTAITLQTLTVRNANEKPVLFLIASLVLGFGVIVILWRRQRPSV